MLFKDVIAEKAEYVNAVILLKIKVNAKKKKFNSKRYSNFKISSNKSKKVKKLFILWFYKMKCTKKAILSPDNI